VCHSFLLARSYVIKGLLNQLRPEDLVYNNRGPCYLLLVPLVDSFATFHAHLDSLLVRSLNNELRHRSDMLNEVLHVTLNFSYYFKFLIKFEFFLAHAGDDTFDLWSVVLMFIHFEMIYCLEDLGNMSLGIDLGWVVAI